MIYLSALLVGVIMTILPCTLPVIALKLRAFGQPKKKWSYIAGIMVSFTVLAACSVLLGTGLSHMGLETFRMTLTVLCSLMGAHLLGVWTMPSFGYKGMLGPFGTGCLTVALGTSCSVPFLAPVMVYCTQSGVLETFGLFWCIGVGFCWMFLVPLPIGRIAKGIGGVWFERVCGVVMMAVAAWLASTLSVPYFLASLMMVLGFMFLFAKRFKDSEWDFKGTGYSMITLGILIILPWGIFSENPDEPVIESTTSDWTTEGPRMIFITADWCMNCKPAYLTVDRVDVVMVMREAGIRHLEVLDFTKTPMDIRRLLVELSGSPSVPLLWIVTDQGKETVLSGLWSTRQVLKALEPSPKKIGS